MALFRATNYFQTGTISIHLLIFFLTKILCEISTKIHNLRLGVGVTSLLTKGLFSMSRRTRDDLISDT